MKLPDKDSLEQIKSLASLARSIIVTTGVGLFFVYCWSEHILPDGLSIGDALLLILIALGFGVVLVLGILYGMVTVIWFVRLLSWFGESRFGKRLGIKSVRQLRGPLKDRDVLLGSILSGLLFALIALQTSIHHPPMDMRWEWTLGFFPACGFLLLIFFGTTGQEENPPSIKFKVVLGAGMMFACLTVFRPALLDITFTSLGLRSSPAALIVMTAAEHERLDGLAKQSGLHIDFCELPEPGKWATMDARALWHGVGTTSYLALVDKDSNGAQSITVPLPRSDMEVIRTYHVALTCKDSLGTQQD